MMGWRDVVPHPVALAAVLAALAGAVLALEQPWGPRSSVPPPPEGLPAHEARFPAAPDFGGATGWVQSPPLDLVALRGQVVLVDFWTYSCINCIHTFPHVQGWFARYNDSGFVVVGVHTPEFRFEHDAANVADAARRYGLTYPIAQDNEYRIWGAYANRYWPAKYLVDQYGRVRYTHFGEGAYLETENVIRQLLQEAGRDPGPGLVERPEAQSGASGLTGELYAAEAGGHRVAIGNPEGYHPGQAVTYARPANLQRDLIYLVGTWHNGFESDTAAENGSAMVRFRGGGGNFVADGPRGACVGVLLDGQPLPRERAARDVRFEGPTPCIVLDGPRSFDFYAGPVEEHTVELQVPQGFELFTFYFASQGRT